MGRKEDKTGAQRAQLAGNGIKAQKALFFLDEAPFIVSSCEEEAESETAKDCFDVGIVCLLSAS